MSQTFPFLLLSLKILTCRVDQVGICGGIKMQYKYIIQLLDKYAHPYDVVYTNFVGTIIYEDEWQIAVRVENGKMI